MAVQCAKVLALLERRLSLLLPPPPTGPFLDLNLNASSSSPTGKMSWLFINTSAASAASTPPSGHIPSKTIEMSCRRIAALLYRRLRSSSRYVLGHFSPFFFVRAYSYCSSSRPQILSADKATDVRRELMTRLSLCCESLGSVSDEDAGCRYDVTWRYDVPVQIR